MESILLQSLRDLPPHRHRADRVSVAQTLSQRDDVRLNIVMLEAKPFPRAAHPRCDLICHDQSSCLFDAAHDLLNKLLGRELDESDPAATWLEDKSANLLEWDLIQA